MNQPTSYTENELVSQLQQGNEKAFNYLYDNYCGALYGIIKSVVQEQETANDVLQEVFVTIWRKINSYDPGKGRLFTWMLNVARNASIDKIRSKGHRDQLKNQPLSDNVDITVTSHSMINDVGLKRLISKLKQEHRMLIDLSYFQGFTHEEIAKSLNMPLGTVKTRIRSALTQLRILMK